MLSSTNITCTSVSFLKHVSVPAQSTINSKAAVERVVTESAIKEKQW